MSAVTTLTDDSLELTGLDITLNPRRKMYINGVDVHIGDDGTNDVILGGKRVLANFTPSQPIDWLGLPPTYLHDAVNRIASVLAALGHKP
jgi:hypothetical protein